MEALQQIIADGGSLQNNDTQVQRALPQVYKSYAELQAVSFCFYMDFALCRVPIQN
jgi:hypothetical protein